MTGSSPKRFRQGFTLMEAIVVLSLFSLISASILDTYMIASRSGARTVQRAQLQADSRAALEAVARAVRVSNFDYASYGGTLPASPTSDLRLISPSTGDVSRIGLGATDASCYSDGKSFPCLRVSTDNGLSWAPLSAKGTKIDAFKAYISPPADPYDFDPFTGTYPADATNPTRQPIATIVISFHGLAPKPADDWVYTLQTTITPRLYVR